MRVEQRHQHLDLANRIREIARELGRIEAGVDHAHIPMW